MRTLKTLTVTILAAACLALPAGWAANKQTAKPKPYPLTTCVVSGQKLGGMGAPYVFTHGNREIKLCCTGCLTAFQKDPAKYLKKIEEAEAQAQKAPKAK